MSLTDKKHKILKYQLKTYEKVPTFDRCSISRFFC